MQQAIPLEALAHQIKDSVAEMDFIMEPLVVTGLAAEAARGLLDKHAPLEQLEEMAELALLLLLLVLL
jgi:hypothetical protein